MKRKSISLRLDDDDLQRIDDLSERLHITRSVLIRRFIEAGLYRNRDTEIKAWDNKTILTIKECNILLAKIGININQITRRCNQNDMSGSLLSEANEIQRVLDYMKEVLKKCL